MCGSWLPGNTTTGRPTASISSPVASDVRPLNPDMVEEIASDRDDVHVSLDTEF